ncbi:MAG: hypothetical protein ABF258_06465, partial [Flavobacteriales bacterium]
MKKTILLILTITMFLVGNTQGYYFFKDSSGVNPGNINTESSDNSYVGWTLVSTGSGPHTTPTLFSSQIIPFNFKFNGGPVNSYRAISNGSISFASNPIIPSSYGSVILPSSTFSDSSVNIVGIQGTSGYCPIVSRTFGSAPNRQHWIRFSQYEYSNSLSPTGSSTSFAIVLEETSNNIYVVEMMSNWEDSQLSVGIQINSSNAITTNFSTLNSNGASFLDNRFVEFIPGVQPSYDLATKSSLLDDFLVKGSTPFFINGIIENRGDSSVDFFDINYRVNSGTTLNATITGVNIPSGTRANFLHPVGWNPTVLGTYTIEVWTSNINSNPDGNTSNDTITFSVRVVDTLIPRKTLLELFTSSTNPLDFAINRQFDSSIVPRLFPESYTIIKYPQNFPGPGDPYSTVKSVARRNFYNINWIPRMEIDGQWDDNTYDVTSNLIYSFQTIPSLISIDILNFSVTGSVANINAEIKPWENLSGNLKYHVVVTEKKTTQNIGTNGETEFYHTMIDILTSINGTSLTSLNKGVTTTVNLSSLLDTTNIEELNDLKVVVFVQDSITKEIFQSEWLDLYIPKTIYEIQYTNSPSGDSPFNNSQIETTGIVTGTHASGYFIQDGWFGEWNGVYINDNINKPNRGDKVTIKGKVNEYFGRTQIIDVDTLIELSTGNSIPKPKGVSSSSISDEKFEGLLVKLPNVVCINPSAGFGEWYVANSGMNTVPINDLIFTFTPIQNKIYFVTGLVDYSFGAFKLEPRDSMDILEVDTIIPRKTLLELFTSSTLSFAKNANRHVDSVVVPTLTPGSYTMIKYPQNWPGLGDPYSTTESVARLSLNNYLGVVPSISIDGQWNDLSTSLTKPIVDSFQAIPSVISIDIKKASIHGSYVSLNAEIKPWTNLSGNLKYHVVVTEKKTTQNVGTNGETEFYHTMMDMLTSINGTSLTSLKKGVSTTINMVSLFDTTNVEEFNDLKLVIFVQDSVTEEIYQSEWMDISTSSFSFDTVIACDSLTWINGVTYYSSNNLVKDTLINSLGGDSIISLNLTINNSSVTSLFQSACDSFNWSQNGVTYNSSGVYYDTLTNTAGCDSVVTLNLTITNSTTGTDSQTA